MLLVLLGRVALHVKCVDSEFLELSRRCFGVFQAYSDELDDVGKAAGFLQVLGTDTVLRGFTYRFDRNLHIVTLEPLDTLRSRRLEVRPHRPSRLGGRPVFPVQPREREMFGGRAIRHGP